MGLCCARCLRCAIGPENHLRSSRALNFAQDILTGRHTDHDLIQRLNAHYYRVIVLDQPSRLSVFPTIAMALRRTIVSITWISQGYFSCRFQRRNPSSISQVAQEPGSISCEACMTRRCVFCSFIYPRFRSRAVSASRTTNSPPCDLA